MKQEILTLEQGQVADMLLSLKKQPSQDKPFPAGLYPSAER